MTIYKNIEILPQWFNERDYLAFKNASLSYILKELYVRRCVHLELSHGDMFPEYFEKLFSYREPYCKDDEYQETIKPESNVVLLSAADVLLYGKHYGMNGDDLFSEANLNNFDVYYGGIIVGLNLELATDAELKVEFSSKLAEFRKQSKFKTQPGRIHLDIQLQKLRSGDLFKYLDLSLWAEKNGFKIHNDVFANAINREKYDADYISNYLSKDAQKAISTYFIEKLERKIESEKKS
tara:strand:+ start:67 stop:777 length:711 start_codon:yes stop_codon:yes gene_type:complete